MINLIAMGGPPTPGWEWMMLGYFISGLIVLWLLYLFAKFNSKKEAPSPAIEYKPEVSDDKWAVRCDCCGCVRKEKEEWVDEHVCCGPGLNFSFCGKCKKNYKACDKVIFKTVKEIRDKRKKV